MQENPMDQANMNRIILALSISTVSIPCRAQAPTQPAQPAPTGYSGCVKRSATDKDILILSGENVCAKLTGTLATDKLVSHEVDLKGVLTERTTSNPASIRIASVTSIGKSCSRTCSLQPPGTRGLNKGGEKPGKEGGTPGAAPTQPH
jgi:hypothetical protein